MASPAPTLQTYILDVSAQPADAYLTIVAGTRELLPSLSVTDTEQQHRMQYATRLPDCLSIEPFEALLGKRGSKTGG